MTTNESVWFQESSCAGQLCQTYSSEGRSVGLPASASLDEDRTCPPMSVSLDPEEDVTEASGILDKDEGIESEDGE